MRSKLADIALSATQSEDNAAVDEMERAECEARAALNEYLASDRYAARVEAELREAKERQARLERELRRHKRSLKRLFVRPVARCLHGIFDAAADRLERHADW